jgi:hypothetical protein
MSSHGVLMPGTRIVAARRMLYDNELTGSLPQQWSAFMRITTM